MLNIKSYMYIEARIYETGIRTLTKKMLIMAFVVY